jgi:ABC-2 type transport system ATP-binding protein
VNVIEASHLTRTFGDLTALDDVSFSVEAGEVFVVLGPNGAGKTTTVRLLNGVLIPSAGSVRVVGLDPAAHGRDVRRRTGVLPAAPALYERLTARQNLEFFGTLYGVPERRLPGRVGELLRSFGLAERAGDRVRSFSTGMKQRLALARTLIHDPEVIFLDEPTTGLDPEAARQTVDLIEQMSRESGRTFFLCTHNLAEAERLCHRVAVLNRGRLLALGTVPELARSLGRGLWVDIDLVRPLGAAAREGLRRLPGVLEIRADTTRLAVEVETAGATPAVVAELVRQGGEILRVDPRRPTLEDVYFALQEQGT